MFTENKLNTAKSNKRTKETDSSRLHLIFVAFFLCHSQTRGKKIQLLRRPIRASDQIPDRFYVISMEFLSLSRRRSSWRNVVSAEEQEETAEFEGYR